MPDSPSSARSEGPAVARLIRSLSLSTRFRFYLAIVEPPGAARALASIVEQGVFAVRESPVHVIHLDPYAAGPSGVAISWRRLFDAVLAPLLEPPAALASPDAIVLADASGAPRGDDDAWTILFRRLNERRDAVASVLHGALVLVLPPRLEAPFARSAPDFWSIRSLAVVVTSDLTGTRGP
jgi:hypothetical protein